MTAPLAVKADAMEIGSITSNLSTLEITRVVDENPADLKEYGLDAPRVEIEFKASGDKDLRRLPPAVHRRQGADRAATSSPGATPRSASSWSRRYTDPIFNRSTFNLRDKALLAIDREKVDRIAVSAAGPGGPERKTLELARDATGWKLTSPTDGHSGSVRG